MFLVDSHCHLDYAPMTDDTKGTLDRANAKGIKAFLTIGTDLSKIPILTCLAESHENVFATVGVHPHEAQTVSSLGDLSKVLVKAAAHPKVVGFGETGLDYFYKHSSQADQISAFKHHIEASLECDIPLIVHTRDAEEDTISLLRDANPRGVIHCFTGTEWMRDKALELGFYISVSGIMTFKKAEDLRQVIKEVPLDRLLLETDAPFLAPEPYRGKLNEPAYLIETAKKLAELKNVSYDDICQQTTHNFLTLFNKVHLSCV